MSTPDQGPQCPPVPRLLFDDYEVAIHASRWGFTQGLAAAQRLAAEEKQKGADAWPQPITDRPPTADDADQDGYVQVLCGGTWQLWEWDVVISKVDTPPWLQTPQWRPPAPSKREQALEDWGTLVSEIHELAPGIGIPMSVQKALEEAGDD
jgi:hypothetical protein